MPAATYDLVPNNNGRPYIEQGATFDITLTCRDEAGVLVDLTGYTARMQIRANKKATTTLLELTTENDRIVMGGAAGTIQLVLPATVTAAIDWTRGVYDLEIVNADGFVQRLWQGDVEVDKEVTR